MNRQLQEFKHSKQSLLSSTKASPFPVRDKLEMARRKVQSQGSTAFEKVNLQPGGCSAGNVRATSKDQMIQLASRMKITKSPIDSRLGKPRGSQTGLKHVHQPLGQWRVFSHWND